MVTVFVIGKLTNINIIKIGISTDFIIGFDKIGNGKEERIANIEMIKIIEPIKINK